MTTSRLDEHLQRLGTLPAGLMQRAMRLGVLDQAFRHWLTPQGAWAQQVSLAQIEAGTVTLTATSAAVATRLRFSEDAITSWFAQQTGEVVTRLKVSVRATQGLGLAGSVGGKNRDSQPKST